MSDRIGSRASDGPLSTLRTAIAATARGPSQALAWRAAAIAVVVFALGLGGVHAARGAGSTAGVVIEVSVRPERDPQVICVGQTRELLVRVNAILLGPEVGWLKVVSALRTEQVATSSDRKVATLTRKEQPTNYGKAEPYQGERYDVSGVNAGTAKLTFKTTIAPGWAGDTKDPYNPFYGHRDARKPLHGSSTVNVLVKKCDYEVGAVHVLPMRDGYVLTAVMDPVRVSADEDGRLSGTGDIDWTWIWQNVCPFDLKLVDKGVAIDGTVDDEGRVTLTLARGRLDYRAPATKRKVGDTTCIDTTGFVELEPIKVAVGAEGDTVREDGTYAWTIRRFTNGEEGGSSVVITVRPIES